MLRAKQEPNPIHGKTLKLCEGLFDDDAIILDQLASTSVRFAADRARIQRTVGFEQFALQGDEPARCAGRRRELPGHVERGDDPGIGEQAFRKVVNARCRADQAVGTADDAGAASQIDGGRARGLGRP